MMLLTHLWQSTLCVGVAALLVFALRNSHARVRHTIWLVASLKFLVPFALLADGADRFAAWALPSATPAASVVIRWIDNSLPGWPLEVAAGSSAVLPWAVPQTLLIAVLGVWAFGAAGVAVWRARHWEGIARIARAAEVLQEGREVDALQRVAGRGHPRRIELLLCPSALEPGVFGMVRPKLLWPAGLSGQLSDVEMEGVLAHELCHVDRRDNLSALPQMVVETVFWFFPVVWWLGARLVCEREQACDEEVLHMGTDRRSYAESILKVCGYCLRSPSPCVAGVGGSGLTQRIENIMTRPAGKPLTLAWRLTLATVGLLTLTVPVAAGVLNASRTGSPEYSAVPAANREIAGAAGGKTPSLVLAVPAPAARRTPVAPAAAPRAPSSSPSRARAARQQPPQVYRAGKDVTFPKLLHDVKPVYTREAMQARIQGMVTLDVVVLENGSVGDVEVTQSLDTEYGLDEQAVKAAKQWLFEPGKKDGKPVAVLVEVEMQFTLK